MQPACRRVRWVAMSNFSDSAAASALTCAVAVAVVGEFSREDACITACDWSGAALRKRADQDGAIDREIPGKYLQ